MDHVVLARALFGTTLGFHIIFATLGVGIPLMVLIAEVSYTLTNDHDYLIMARRWTKGFTVLLAVSITTGTTVALQLSLLWPRFMRIVGQVIALPFLIEIFAFFLEAVFMSIYVYAADRIPQRWRIFSVSLVALGAALSALLITDANAFMNTPQGFRFDHGRVTDVHPWQAVFNPALPTSDLHVLISAYMTVPFILATVAAYGLLRRVRSQRERQHQEKALMLCLSLGGLFGIMTAISGDASGKFLAKYQPLKLAAGEGLFHSMRHAPLVVGGWVDAAHQQTIWGIRIPSALSFLATDRWDGYVKGLDAFPRDEWPPLFVHDLFDAMVGCGSLLIVVALGAWLIKTLRRKTDQPFPTWLLWVFVLTGPLALVSIECGWCYGCISRQPWIIYGLMRTADAVTNAPHVGLMFGLFISLYALLGVATILVLVGYFRRHPLTQDIQEPNSGWKRTVWLP
ncbi:MAG: cytochrome ubiquinol oxidase subunit I [Alicyclobacillaceae bacterium]|uniref:cytochrome ubiquinol oxidase subunit I n=1 Tax=Alicyclobacillus sp. SP_1 TaxID=2942475 RepID=UPI002158301F|nr:cytochrome ubiquinol oxidase subunit I [Alicyclobacillus sp. SP_1]MCY0889288.1 cytochrome ubiquinol oxidase subunit I [Alicyclobacillaceae bacterium]MCY0894709.1 cytochrome ubiquinol oxidase subunit I [Alicyclobacillaceae bacterium]